VVSAPAELQRERVLARPDMNEAKLDAILARQMADAEKRARAHFVVDTSQGFEHARAQVRDIIAQLKHPDWRPPRLEAAAKQPQ
jgi:dephospho-CoA kinase